MAGSPTTKRRTGPLATATFNPSSGKVLHGGLQEDERQRDDDRYVRRHRPSSHVFIKPAGHGIAGKTDDAAAIAVDFADERRRTPH